MTRFEKPCIRDFFADRRSDPLRSLVPRADECLYLREYTSGCGFGHSETNDLISNFKKKPDRRGKPEYRWKDWAIRKMAEELRGANLNAQWFAKATLVPMPPSKAKNDALYDDRLCQVLNLFADGKGYDIRELLCQRESTEAAHETSTRRPPSELAANYFIDEAIADPAPNDIGLFDDVLTTGAHFKAASSVLRRRFPGVRIVGIFIARRVFSTEPND